MIFNMAGGGGTGGILTVTGPVGATATVTKDNKMKTKTIGSDGVVVFKGLTTGTWTLTITDGEQTSTKPVVITTDYDTVIAFFAATISITYPAGSMCSCSDGTTTFNAPDTSGFWECIVPNDGTWTLSCTDGVETTEDIVTITSDGQRETIELSYTYYLFNYGDVEKVTGGWKKKALTIYETWSEEPTVTTGEDGSWTITTSSSNRGGVLYATNKFNLKDYTKLRFNGEFSTNSNQYTQLAIWSEFGSSHIGQNRISMATETIDGTAEIDISSLDLETGYYIGFFVYAAHTIRIHRLWLE